MTDHMSLLLNSVCNIHFSSFLHVREIIALSSLSAENRCTQHLRYRLFNLIGQMQGKEFRVTPIVYCGFGLVGHVLPFVRCLKALQAALGEITVIGDEVTARLMKDVSSNVIPAPFASEQMLYDTAARRKIWSEVEQEAMTLLESTLTGTKIQVLIADQFSVWAYQYGKKHKIPVVELRSSFFNFENKIVEHLMFESELNFASIPQELESCSDVYIKRTDKRFVYLGPCLRQSTTPFDISRFKKSIVYISLGTTLYAAGKIDFFRNAINYFSTVPDTTVLMSVLDVYHDKVTQGIVVPEHIIIKSSWPQVEVLQVASVFITHGGVGGVCEAIAAGIPMIIFPQGSDQFQLVAAAVNLGLGVQLSGSSHAEIQASYQSMASNYKLYKTKLNEAKMWVRPAAEVENTFIQEIKQVLK